MQIKRLTPARILLFSFFFLPFLTQAQVNSVEYGKNRMQYKKFSWKFYQSPNFNVYYNEGGLELAKYITQMAEEELPELENNIEYSLQRRANIVIYNNYDDYKTSNIGLGSDWQNGGGVTKLVNNKIAIYFDGNHNQLRLKVREGIARVLTDNILFGDDIGEFASNQALLDLPQWLTDGYVEYMAEPWSTAKDDELKSAILSGDYSKFYQFAFDKPTLAGHAFWYYIARKYKPENVTYFLYLARLYKNLNTASVRICKKKFKDVLVDFMTEEGDRYLKDLKQRRNAPRGKLSVVEEITKSDFIRFAANPNARNNSYAVVQYTRGNYCVKYVNNLYEEKVLLDYGVKTQKGDINPNSPILAWDGKGSRLLCIYTKEGKTYMFIYDVIANIKRFKQEITGFDQILDAGYIFDANSLLFSAVKNGHTDIFTYRIDNGKIKQVTNDVYDDLDPTFVTFPNRLGIIFASNRPYANAPDKDTVLPSRNKFNIFLADINSNSEFQQISQLTKMKFGDARYPMPYNVNHFTFVSDENGINNRWAGFFTTQADGLDTLYFIGDEVLRNPDDKEIDSTLTAWQKLQPDSVGYFAIHKDSAYTFPITNYQSGLLETRVAGNNDQVSEVRREGDMKFLYKLRVDSVTLRKRNITARPTEYLKSVMLKQKIADGKAIQVTTDTVPAEKTDIFQNEFDNDKDSSIKIDFNEVIAPAAAKENMLAKSSLYDYKLKFDADFVLAGISNNVLPINRYQPYTGGNGPIVLTNDDILNLSLRVGVSDIMEDIKFIGGIRFGTSLTDKDAFVSFQNFRKQVDWGVTYFRSNKTNFTGFLPDKYFIYDNAVYTNIFQFNFAYPFNEIKSFRATVGLRTDRGVVKPVGTQFADFLLFDTSVLSLPDTTAASLITRFEYVHDNTLHPTENIWNGLRWKVYSDFSLPVSKSSALKGKKMFNIGYDARYYHKIYRNFIWAVRAAGDFSFGEAKVLYYLGGSDAWISPKFLDYIKPDPSENYAFQTLAVNMRGYEQNIANGSDAMVFNSELRLPVFTTFFNKPVNSAFLRNFQLVQFFDFGTAWAGGLKNIKRPSTVFVPTIIDGNGNEVPDPSNPVVVKLRTGGIGPFAGGYGFGARSTLLGYFMKIDAGWPMNVFFSGKPIWYFSLGFDF